MGNPQPARCVAVGSDHGGLALKYELLSVPPAAGFTVRDLGCCALPDACGVKLDETTGALKATTSVDYPDYAEAVANAVLSGECELGILVCGTGIGMSIAANKINGIRAALCSDPYSAAMAREHNDANVLCLGGRVVGVELAKAIVAAFLGGRFAGDRHQRRLDKIAKIAQASAPMGPNDGS